MSGKKIATKEEARNFLVSYHNLNGSQDFAGTAGVLRCFGLLGSIQYDPLNVVGRNADLVLQSRVQGYKPHMLYELLYEKRELVDGFDKEMCIYPSEEFRLFGRIREAASEGVKRTLAYRGQSEALDSLEEVKAQIREKGMSGTKDISLEEAENMTENRWGHKKLSSAALDYLYNAGELCVVKKNGTQKYFDFTGKVLPQKVLEREDFSNENDFMDWYIKRRIQSVGFLWNKRSSAWQGHYISNADKRTEAISRLCERGELRIFHIEGIDIPFYMAAGNEKLLGGSSAGKQVRFLAPLDNFLWDREMIERIFGFEYRWEVYTPVVKRKYGYYVLPVLFGNELVARFEPEKCLKDAPLQIKNWWWEPDTVITDELLEQVNIALRNFAEYLSVPSCIDYFKGEPDKMVEKQ